MKTCQVAYAWQDKNMYKKQYVNKEYAQNYTNEFSVSSWKFLHLEKI